MGALLGVDAVPGGWLESSDLRQETEAVATDLHVRSRDDEWRARYSSTCYAVRAYVSREGACATGQTR